jgi:CRISPR-associated endonuclease Csn1
MQSDKTLGIDLGSNSLGWAILDNITGDIADKGVLVFPEGIDPANDTLETPAAIRRAVRAARRMKFRRKIRKWQLLKDLIKNGMTPLNVDELLEWKNNGVYPLSNQAFIKWLKSTDTSNPYLDRANAASGRVDKQVLGRALYHLAQRRGFKSSRKDAAGADEDASAQDKELGKVKGDIAALTAEIKAAGCKTLGQYFAKVMEENKNSPCKERVRKRYTGRLEHYETEFAAIMEAQGYTADNQARKDLHRAIFYQRPLRSQKHLVGGCPLESGDVHSKKHKVPRCQIAHPLFEEFRMLAFVNNLSLEDEDGNRFPLTSDDRAKVVECFYRKSSTFKFSVIAKKFVKAFKQNGLKFHYYSDADTLAASNVTHQLNEVFGETPYDRQMVFDALTFFDDNDKLIAWAHKHFPALDDCACKKLAAIHPKEGNANYSLKAIRKMLPFLRKGYKLYDALLWAKMPDLIPDFAAKESEIKRRLDEIKFAYEEERTDERPGRNAPKLKRLEERYQDYFADEFGWSEAEWSKLYINRTSAYRPQISYKNNEGKMVELETPRIPKVELGMIRNPLVQRSMTTLRRLVNFLADHGKIDERTTIRIELARTVNDFATRTAIKRWNQKREALREEAKAEIAKYGKAVTEDAIDRYLLWQEQEGVCLYTGEQIKIADLLEGNRFDVEHTIPRSLSGDDSMANKTICSAKYNREVKQGRIPAECPNYEEVMGRLRNWEEHTAQLEKDYRSQRGKVKGMMEQAARSNARIKALSTKFELDYWRDKLRRFKVTMEKFRENDGGLSGFKRRQLVDTGIMSSHAVELLKSVYPLVYAVNGTATAFARKAWGIQGDEVKDRTEHTHHAKDAMVIAALTPARFNAICAALKDDGVVQPRPCDVCPEPYPDFAEKVRKATGGILVKHVLRQTTMRQSSKRNVLAKAHPAKSNPGKIVSAVLSKGDTVRGQLHKDTFYGCIQKPNQEARAYVVRKPLVGPVKAAKAIADKIVDPAIKEIVTQALAQLEVEGKNNVESGDIKMPSGVPINKVRIYAHVSDPNKLHDHAIPSAKEYKNPYYVESGAGSNFRLALFDIDGKPSVRPDNSLDWAQNHKKPNYMPYDKMPGFVGYIMPGSMALTHDGDKIGHLYKVVKFSGDGRVTFRLHTEARMSVVLEKELQAIGKNKKGESKIDFVNPHEMLLVSPAVYLKQMYFEGINFKMLLDGTIKFLDKKE